MIPGLAAGFVIGYLVGYLVGAGLVLRRLRSCEALHRATMAVLIRLSADATLLHDTQIVTQWVRAARN